MFENLDQSYTFNNNFKHNVKTIAMVSMGFILIVLYFQPFGINFLKSVNDSYFVLASGILIACTLFANTLLLPGLMPSVFDPLKWTIRKELIWNIWLFSNLYIIIFLLALYVREIEFADLPVFRTGALALLPLVLFNLINYNHSLKEKVVDVIDSGKHWFKEDRVFFREDKTVTNKPAEIKLTAVNGKDVFTANEEQVILFHSAGNYIEIFLVPKEGKRKKIFRQSLGYVEEKLAGSSDFKKCHRCWIVNMSKVKGISRNSKGYFLDVKDIDFKVPVSRNCVPFFREELIYNKD